MGPVPEYTNFQKSGPPNWRTTFCTSWCHAPRLATSILKALPNPRTDYAKSKLANTLIPSFKSPGALCRLRPFSVLTSEVVHKRRRPILSLKLKDCALSAQIPELTSAGIFPPYDVLVMASAPQAGRMLQGSELRGRLKVSVCRL